MLGSPSKMENSSFERLTVDQVDIFSDQRIIPINESSDLLISQGNTLHISTPLFAPKTQVLGVRSSPEEEKEIISYTVQPGDSIDTIASHFGISRKTILWANELKGSTIKPGQELIILPVSGVFHIITPGDTIKDIADKYKADVGEIIEFNELTGEEDIKLGDILIIPGGEIKKPAKTAHFARSPSISSSWLIPPTSGRISQGLHWYNAVDIATNCGNPIYAAAGGTIQLTGYDSVGGNFVRILHPNGIVTYYGHMSRIRVSTGQVVSQGDHIGDIGNTGYTIGPTGCHLHFEVRGGTNPFLAYPRGHRF